MAQKPLLVASLLIFFSFPSQAADRYAPLKNIAFNYGYAAGIKKGQSSEYHSKVGQRLCTGNYKYSESLKRCVKKSVSQLRQDAGCRGEIYDPLGMTQVTTDKLSCER